jgi:glycerol-3-phosphate acyltransferase PlsX
MDTKNKVSVVVDAMGGDFAPVNEVAGAILACKDRGEFLKVILVGKEDVLKKELSKQGGSEGIEIVNADEVVTMDDSPTDVYKSKPNSSINVGLALLKEKKADGFISAGNTGAVMAASTLKLGRIKGVGRPTIGSIFPSNDKKTMVFDVGASVDCKPMHLKEFAIMGTIYMEHIFGVKNPSVGLLSVGEEKEKGNELTFEAYELLEKSGLNFFGNVEGRDVLNGKVDVIVCDGFVGNIILKFAEGVLDLLKAKFRSYAGKSFGNKLWMGMIQGTLREILKDFDYQEYGGVPLLGVDGVSIIGHGKSSPLAIRNMIFKAEEVVRKDVCGKIREEINK